MCFQTRPRVTGGIDCNVIYGFLLAQCSKHSSIINKALMYLFYAKYANTKLCDSVLKATYNSEQINIQLI